MATQGQVLQGFFAKMRGWNARGALSTGDELYYKHQLIAYWDERNTLCLAETPEEGWTGGSLQLQARLLAARN